MEPSSEGFVVKYHSPIDDELVRTAALLVDRFDIPENNFLFYELPILDHLNAVGLLSRSKVIFGGTPEYRQVSSYGWATYVELDRREPGQWSIWQHSDQSLVPAEDLSADLAFQLQLTNGLIVPASTVSYQDLLNFKKLHSDELLALRHYLEELAIKLSQEGDLRAIRIEQERFDAALAGYLSKARKSNIDKAITTLTAEVDWSAAIKQSILAGGGAGILSSLGNLNLATAATAIGGSILTALSVKSVVGRAKSDASPFRYIARIEKELGG